MLSRARPLYFGLGRFHGGQLRKIISVIVAALGLALSFPALAQPVPEDRLIVPGVRIGEADLAPADQGALTRALGAPDRAERQDGMDYYHYDAGGADPDRLVIAFDLAADQPFEISTASPFYRTREGLGVGSSEAAILAGLGKPLCRGGDPAGEAVIAYDSIWFLLARGAVTRVSIRAQPGSGDFGAIACKPS